MIAVEVTERDAIAGVRPRAAYAPATIDECAELLDLRDILFSHQGGFRELLDRH